MENSYLHRTRRFFKRLIVSAILLPLYLFLCGMAFVTVQIEGKKLLTPGTVLSYELEFVDPAPPAPTRRQRVWLYLHQRRELILAAAARYNISPIAIAGVIAWEGLMNPEERFAAWYLYVQKLKFEGPGKVHAGDFDADLRFDKNAAAWLEGNARYTPMLPMPEGPAFLPAIVRRVMKLSTTEGSIEYIAAIMNGYATEAELAGYGMGTGKYLQQGFRQRPEILATYFNGAKGFDLPHADWQFYQRMRKRGFAPFRRSCFAGSWIEKNLPYLYTALGLETHVPTVLDQFEWYVATAGMPIRRVQKHKRYLPADGCSIF